MRQTRKALVEISTAFKLLVTAFKQDIRRILNHGDHPITANLKSLLTNSNHSKKTFAKAIDSTDAFDSSAAALDQLHRFHKWVAAIDDEEAAFAVKHSLLKYGLEHIFLRDMDDEDRQRAAETYPTYREEVLSVFGPAAQTPNRVLDLDNWEIVRLYRNDRTILAWMYQQRLKKQAA